MASGGGEWPDWLRAKAIVLDFDKTITNRHTRGAVFQHSGLDENELRKNFADLEFFQRFIPVIAKHALVCIATFADDEAEALLSGKKLVRRYLDVALGPDSAKLIPDDNIEAWNPENKELDMKVVGKNIHLENLRKKVCKGMKKSQIVLFDDSDRNCQLARKLGYTAQYVEAASADEGEKKPDTGFCAKSWSQFLEAEAVRKDEGGGCCVF